MKARQMAAPADRHIAFELARRTSIEAEARIAPWFDSTQSRALQQSLAGLSVLEQSVELHKPNRSLGCQHVSLHKVTRTSWWSAQRQARKALSKGGGGVGRHHAGRQEHVRQLKEAHPLLCLPRRENAPPSSQFSRFWRSTFTCHFTCRAT